MALTTLPAIADNASAAFPACLLRAQLACLTIFSKPLHLLVRSQHNPTLRQRTRLISITIVRMVIERAVSIDTIVTPCSQNRVQFFPSKMHLYQVTFMTCLIFATSLWLSPWLSLIVFQALLVIQSSISVAHP